MRFEKFALRPTVPVPTLLLLGVLGALACTGGEGGADAARLQSLQDQRSVLVRQFGSVQGRIRTTQATALTEPNVAAARDRFYEELERFARAGGPEDVELMQRALEIGADLTRLSTPVVVSDDGPTASAATPEERQEIARRLAETERDMRPFVERALADSAVRSSFGALRDSLVVTMERLDPGTRSALEQMNRVAERIREVDASIALLRGPR